MNFYSITQENPVTLQTILYTVQSGMECNHLGLNHRRRIELEDKAKVVASDWGTESLPR